MEPGRTFQAQSQGRQSINRERRCQIVRIEDSIQWNLTNFHWTGGGSGEVRQSAIALPRTKCGAELAAEAAAAAEKVEQQQFDVINIQPGFSAIEVG